MAKLHSLLALQQFMQGLGEDMEEAELVRSTRTETNELNQLNQRREELIEGLNMAFTANGKRQRLLLIFVFHFS